MKNRILKLLCLSMIFINHNVVSALDILKIEKSLQENYSKKIFYDVKEGVQVATGSGVNINKTPEDAQWTTPPALVPVEEEKYKAHLMMTGEVKEVVWCSENDSSYIEKLTMPFTIKNIGTSTLDGFKLYIRTNADLQEQYYLDVAQVIEVDQEYTFLADISNLGAHLSQLEAVVVYEPAESNELSEITEWITILVSPETINKVEIKSAKVVESILDEKDGKAYIEKMTFKAEIISRQEGIITLKCRKKVNGIWEEVSGESISIDCSMIMSQNIQWTLKNLDFNTESIEVAAYYNDECMGKTSITSIWQNPIVLQAGMPEYVCGVVSSKKIIKELNVPFTVYNTGEKDINEFKLKIKLDEIKDKEYVIEVKNTVKAKESYTFNVELHKLIGQMELTETAYKVFSGVALDETLEEISNSVNIATYSKELASYKMLDAKPVNVVWGTNNTIPCAKEMKLQGVIQNPNMSELTLKVRRNIKGQWDDINVDTIKVDKYTAQTQDILILLKDVTLDTSYIEISLHQGNKCVGPKWLVTLMLKEELPRLGEAYDADNKILYQKLLTGQCMYFEYDKYGRLLRKWII